MAQMALPVRGINHISLIVKDIAESVAFYVNVLGFCEIRRPQQLRESFPGGAWLYNRGGACIHLIAGQPVPRSSEIKPDADHISLEADCDLEEVARRLEAMKIRYLKNLVLEDGIEVTQLFFLTPDNLMIEVCDCDCLPIIPLDQHDASVERCLRWKEEHRSSRTFSESSSVDTAVRTMDSATF